MLCESLAAPYVVGLELIMYLPSTDPLLSSEDRKMAEWWNLKAGKKGTALLFTIQDPGTKPNMQKGMLPYLLPAYGCKVSRAFFIICRIHAFPFIGNMGS